MPLHAAIGLRIGDYPRLAQHLVHRVVHVPVDPQWRLVACDERIEIRRERRVQAAFLVPGPDAAPARRVVGDDEGGESGLSRLLELDLNERPILDTLDVPLCAFLRCQQSGWRALRSRIAPAKSGTILPISRCAHGSSSMPSSRKSVHRVALMKRTSSTVMAPRSSRVTSYWIAALVGRLGAIWAREDEFPENLVIRRHFDHPINRISQRSAIRNQLGGSLPASSTNARSRGTRPRLRFLPSPRCSRGKSA